MKTFEVEMLFNIRCVTHGWTIEATNQEEADRKAAECIDSDGQLDENKMREHGLMTESWDTVDGEGFDYELDTVVEITD